MDKVYLQEAFKALDILNEEDFDISSTDGIDELKDFVDNDENIDFENVIDPEAETEEDLKDSYIGNVILDCKVCHSKLYKKPEEIEFDEETGFANIDEECPYCFSLEGYDVVGQVAPFSDEFKDEEADEKDDSVDVEVDGEEVEVEDKEEEEDESLKEDFQNVSIETDTQKMEMTSDESGKVTVTSEPKKEMIVPVDDDIQSEINPVIEPEEDELSAEEVEMDIDDFSEDEFNELGESYLKKVYENVNSFKTSAVKSINNKLIVEGVIGFASGKNKKTSFVFEGKDISNNNSVRFIGENLQLSKGKKSFTLKGNLNNGKFIAESLNYNYRAKDSNGKSTRLYGTVKVSK